MLYAIDVSHHQDPEKLDWASMRKAGCDVCIVRLTYGTKKDRSAKEHIRRARENGFAIGAYAFARTVERIADQYIAFAEAAEAAGYGQPEDLVPALDIEDDTASRPLAPEHAPLFEKFLLYLRNWKLTTCFAYITARDWERLGKPGWVLRLPLFVAHYAAPSRREPATPNGMPWCIWQHRVAPFQIQGESGYDKEHPLLDQSRIRKLHFLNGEEMVFDGEGDEALRRTPDTDDTALRRGERNDAILRAYAASAASDSMLDLLESGRHEEMRQTMPTLDEEPDPVPEGDPVT